MPQTKKPADYREMAGRRNAVWVGPEGAVARLVAGEERMVLTLPDWGVGPARGVAWEPSRPPRRRHGGTHA
jgi:hypothetical protein